MTRKEMDKLNIGDKVEELTRISKEAEAEEIMNHYDEGCKKWSELFAKMK